MRAAHTADAVRAAEAGLRAELPEGTLMDRAAAGLAAVCGQLLGATYGARVLLLVGGGDNGGDALLAGARLAGRGAAVDAVLVGQRPDDPLVYRLRRAGGRVVPAPATTPYDLVVDGIVGIGARGGLRDDAAAVVSDLAAGSTVVAVDLPSGVHADTGEVTGVAVRADVTVTFGTLKPGLLVDPGAAYAGVVEVVDIGLADRLGPADVTALQQADVAALLPQPGRESDKYRRGVVGVAAGSSRYPGAAVLCVGGAVRAGAGMVRYVGDDAAADLVRRAWPEAVVGPGRVQAWTVGSGGGDEIGPRLEQALGDGVPVLVDADGLSALAARPGGSALPPLLLTPHAGELARLLGVDRSEVEARRLHFARAAAAQLGAVVLLKGATTVVARPDGQVRVNPTGTPVLATAGSGDVLAGLAGALLAGGLAPYDAGSVAAYLHGLAGRIAAEDGTVSAQDVLAALPRALAGGSAGAVAAGVGGWETGRR